MLIGGIALWKIATIAGSIVVLSPLITFFMIWLLLQYGISEQKKKEKLAGMSRSERFFYHVCTNCGVTGVWMIIMVIGAALVSF